MAAIRDAWLEHQRNRFMRPDGHRYFWPDAPRRMTAEERRSLGRLYPRCSLPDATERKIDSNGIAEAVSIEVGRSELLRLKWILADLKFDLALLRFARKFRVDQLRDYRGRFADEGGGAARGELTRVAAKVPKIPQKQPPDSSERTKVAKEVARWVAENGGVIADVIAKTSWLYHAVSNIVSYLDAPKTLEELQEDASIAKAGYDRHHIVEQTSAEEDGYPRKRIDAPENLVRIPRMRHWEINAWYQTANDRFDGMSPREYLRHKDWDERQRVGMEALRRFGVLKP